MSKIRKIIERLLVFLIGVPAVFALIFLFPHYHHLALNIVIIAFSGIGAIELSNMLKKKDIFISKPEAFILGILTPLTSTLVICFEFPTFLIEGVLMAGFLWALISKIFEKQDKLNTVIYRVLGGISLIIYPGFFMYWLIKMTSWQSSAAIFLFLLIVFANDSSAWLFGSLFGKNNKGLFSVSPNKSIAGFLGGLFGSIVVPVSAFLFFKSNFPVENFSLTRVILTAIILGLSTGVFASFGDLAESAIKRSCDCKDSGNIILGRGGILDSTDSIGVAAPVFYFIYSFLLHIHI